MKISNYKSNLMFGFHFPIAANICGKMPGPPRIIQKFITKGRSLDAQKTRAEKQPQSHHNRTTSAYYRISTSAHHRIIASPHQHITRSLDHNITQLPPSPPPSLDHRITAPPHHQHHNITASTQRCVTTSPDHETTISPNQSYHRSTVQHHQNTTSH